MASKDASFLLRGDTVNSRVVKTNGSSVDSKDAIFNSTDASDIHVLRRATIKLDMVIVPLVGLYCTFSVPC